jgi:putative flippase GtrA
MLATELRRFLRFVVVGTVNTLLTGSLLILIAQWVDIDIAYTIVCVVGLILTTLLVPRFVFHQRMRPRTAGRFAVWCVCVYLLGVSIVHLAVHDLHGSHLLATCAVLTITAPLNFLGGRLTFGVSASPLST